MPATSALTKPDQHEGPGLHLDEPHALAVGEATVPPSTTGSTRWTGEAAVTFDAGRASMTIAATLDPRAYDPDSQRGGLLVVSGTAAAK